MLCGIARAEAPPCVVPDATVAATLLDRWNTTLKTQHPDRVTRLFTADASVLGFASPIARANYMAIRDYYLYFLQFEPQVSPGARALQTGCNFLIDQGTYTLTLKNRATGDVEKREARYRFIYEFTHGEWRIAQHIDMLLPGTLAGAFAVPPPSTPRVALVDSTTGTAVAGFVKREPPSVAPASRLNGPPVRGSRQGSEAEDAPQPKPQRRSQQRPSHSALRDQKAGEPAGFYLESLER